MFRFHEELPFDRVLEFFFILMYDLAFDFSISSVIILERYPESSSSASMVLPCLKQDRLSDFTICNPNLLTAVENTARSGA
jgi:hypothetical protein